MCAGSNSCTHTIQLVFIWSSLLAHVITFKKGYMKTKPIITITDITDNLDGSSLVSFETNEAFDKMYLKNTGRKNLTNRDLEKYLTEIITKAIEEKDGFSIKRKSK